MSALKKMCSLFCEKLTLKQFHQAQRTCVESRNSERTFNCARIQGVFLMMVKNLREDRGHLEKQFSP